MRLIPHPSTQPTVSPPPGAASTTEHARPAPPNEARGNSKTSHPSTSSRSARATFSRLVSSAIVTALLLTTHTADSAQASTHVVALATTVDQVFTNIRNWLVGILAGLATVFLTVGGVRYLLAGGDPGETEKAKSAFRNAAWGYGLAALAPLAVEILRGIVGA
ncbi:Hypothetical protein AJAP_07490 [Amycolatopsis japonica]|uniref:TrbC/VIRB2 family protein n=1 Tax=Amycolatopsis japonica TaxID=208439 RepID=A0A075UVY5_9PSEU|nr:Hypothetical protein AJAP_07490 [Amycolatopsis japonica]